jgi:hypothetical protein
MSELRKTILESDLASPEAVKSVFSRLTRKALGDPKKGIPPDLEAIRVYLSYTLGRPVQAVEISGFDGEPLALQWSKVEAAIIAALAPFGDQARFAVALALRGLVTDADGAAEPAEPQA